MSRVIKSHYAQNDVENKRVINLKPIYIFENELEETLEDEQLVEEEEPTVNLKEIEEEAEAIIENAKSEADSIIQEVKNQYEEMIHQIEIEKQNWEVEKEHWIETAKEQGHQHGFEQGKEEGYQEYRSIIENAKSIVELAEKDYQKNIEQSELTILQLGIKAAERIMGFTLDVNPDAFLNLVKRVIKDARDHQDIKIYIHPSYYDLVLSQKGELLSLLNNPTAELYVYPEEELELTNCIIESSFGRIDASIDSQLSELKAKLLQILEGEMDDENS